MPPQPTAAPTRIWASRHCFWGMPTTRQEIDNNASYYISRPFYAFYAHDDWRVNNRLTLNIGLRYEVQVPLPGAL